MSEAARSARTAARVFVVGGTMVLALVVGLFAFSYLLWTVLGLPPSLGVPPVAKLFGGAVVVGGLAMAGWTFSARSPSDMMLSTYVTIGKALKRAPVTERSGRTEPLVVGGPQRYTRNPLYFGVVLVVSGSALIFASTFLLLATLVFLAWFVLVLIPYEEKELKALFGEEWVRYSADTPMLVPFIKRKK